MPQKVSNPNIGSSPTDLYNKYSRNTFVPQWVIRMMFNAVFTPDAPRDATHPFFFGQAWDQQWLGISIWHKRSCIGTQLSPLGLTGIWTPTPESSNRLRYFLRMWQNNMATSLSCKSSTQWAGSKKWTQPWVNATQPAQNPQRSREWVRKTTQKQDRVGISYRNSGSTLGMETWEAEGLLLFGPNLHTRPGACLISLTVLAASP